MLTFWITVACGTDMLLFGYDQGVFLLSITASTHRTEIQAYLLI
jgi:hypothetical protein